MQQQTVVSLDHQNNGPKIILYLLFGPIWKHPQIEKFDP